MRRILDLRIGGRAHALEAYARQQAAVASLGLKALEGMDLGVLMDEAVASVAYGLDAEFATVLELQPDGDSLLLRAGVGWPAGMIDRLSIQSGAGSQAGYTLLVKGPVIVTDYRRETRFTMPSLLLEQGVVSGISVVIPRREGAFGVLSAQMTTPRGFDPEDANFLQAMANVLAAAIERKRVEDVLAAGEERYRTLLERNLDERKRVDEARAEHATKLQMLARVALTINAAISVDHVLAVVTERARELIGAHQAVTSLTVNEDWGQAITSVSLSEKYAAWRNDDAKPGPSGVHRLVCEWNQSMRMTQTELEAHLAGPDVEGPAARRPPLRGWLAAPLTGRGGRNMGFIQLSDRYEGDFTEGDEAILVQLAQLASIALENARLYEQTEQRQRAAESLARVGRVVSQSLDPRIVSRQVVENVCVLLSAKSAALYELEASTEDLVVVNVAREADSSFHWIERLLPGTGVAGAAVDSRQPVAAADVRADPRLRYHPDVQARLYQDAPRAILGVPLVVQQRVFGALCVGDDLGRIFNPEEIRFAQAFADQVAVALENARLFREMRQAYGELSRTQEQLVQAQKMDAIGRLAGGVAHDFNNLLTVIIGRCELLRQRLPADQRLTTQVELVLSTAERAVALTRQLLAFGRKQMLQPQILDVNAVVTDLGVMLHRLIGEDVTLRTVLEARPARVKADPSQLQQVIVNLVVNARDAMPTGGALTITTGNAAGGDSARPAGLPSRPCVTISVSDTGHGIDADVRPHLFEPFFTTKPKGQGTGLGLATVYGIVTQSDGHVEVDSAPGRGATFTVYLPLIDAASEAPVAASRGAAVGGAETILLVEDERDVRELAREILTTSGYTVLTASNATEALAAADRHAGPLHLMVTDVVMPGMSGRILAGLLAPRYREMKVLYISGYTDDAIVRHGVGAEGVAFLAKPFSPAVLARKVRDVLDATESHGGIQPEGSQRGV